MEQHTGERHPAPTEQQAPPAVRPLPSLRIEVDATKLELGDIIILDDVAQNRPYDVFEVARMLDRVVVGGLAGRPLNHFKPLLGQLLALVRELANPKGEGSG